MIYIGLDIGTTTVGAVALDTVAGSMVANRTIPHPPPASADPSDSSLAAELDITTMRETMLSCIASVVRDTGERASEIAGIGVTGQMHGVAFLGSALEPAMPAITWQDRRAEEPATDGDGSWLDCFIRTAGGADAFEPMGCVPAAGYMGPTLFRLLRSGSLPESVATACPIPDAAVAILTGQRPLTDPTDAGSSGLFDVRARRWHGDVALSLGIPLHILPEVRRSGAFAGGIERDISATTGITAGTPVYVAIGDNQASFVGSVREPDTSLLLNVGTGSQISAVTDEFIRPAGLEVRCFVDERYLLVVGGLFGGRSYSYLRDFFALVGERIHDTGNVSDSAGDEVYDRMNRLAAEVAPGSDGVRCSPLFTGSREDPSRRGDFTGISPENLTPGHLTRALLEGIAEGFHEFYEAMRPATGERSLLVGSGNGVRKNALLARILSDRFERTLNVPEFREEAAAGAATLAAVGTGEFGSVSEATRSLRYEERSDR